MLYTKQLDLTSVFITIQLLYCFSVLLLTSRYKLAPAQHTKVIIIWHLYEAFQKKIKTVSLYLSFMTELKAF